MGVRRRTFVQNHSKRQVLMPRVRRFWVRKLFLQKLKTQQYLSPGQFLLWQLKPERKIVDDDIRSSQTKVLLSATRSTFSFELLLILRASLLKGERRENLKFFLKFQNFCFWESRRRSLKKWLFCPKFFEIKISKIMDEKIRKRKELHKTISRHTTKKVQPHNILESPGACFDMFEVRIWNISDKRMKFSSSSSEFWGGETHFSWKT